MKVALAQYCEEVNAWKRAGDDEAKRMNWGYGCYTKRKELDIIICNGVYDRILLGELHDQTRSPPPSGGRVEKKVEACCNQPIRQCLVEIR